MRPSINYDHNKDPLIQIKYEDVVVEDQLDSWQEKLNKNKKARRLDLDQSITEQAYAAAVAYRWTYVDHPHRRQTKRPPRWIVPGFLFEEETENYLLKIAHRRTDRMKRTTKELMAEAA
jgi:hypothetical protein